MMRAHWLQLPFVVLLGCALTAGAGCGGDNHQGAGIGGQSGSGGGGSTGTAGEGGGGARGGGAAGASACVTSTGAAGTAGGSEPSPQRIHDALLNAPTAGGINVTRTPPTATYPTCQ